MADLTLDQGTLNPTFKALGTSNWYCSEVLNHLYLCQKKEIYKIEKDEYYCFLGYGPLLTEPVNNLLYGTGIPETWLIDWPSNITLKNNTTKKVTNKIYRIEGVSRVEDAFKKLYTTFPPTVFSELFSYYDGEFYLIITNGNKYISYKRDSDSNNSWVKSYGMLFNTGTVNIQLGYNLLTLNKSDLSLKDGFYYKLGYIKNGEPYTKESYFIFDRSEGQMLTQLTDATTAYSEYNSSSNNNNIIGQTHEYNASPRQDAGYYYKTPDPGIFDQQSRAITYEEAISQRAYTISEGLANYGKSVQQIFSSGTSTEAPSYITQYNAFRIKIKQGKDNRDGGKEPNCTLETLDDKYCRLFINMKKSDGQDFVAAEVEPLSIKQVTENVTPKQMCLKLNALKEHSDLILKIEKNNGTEIEYEKYFELDPSEREDYSFNYYNKDGSLVEDFTSFKEFLEHNKESWMTSEEKCSISVDLSIDEIQRNSFNLSSLELFEAYTRGRDVLAHSYTTIRPAEYDSNDNKLMNVTDNYFKYKYSGRTLDMKDNELLMIHEANLLLETDVTLGDTYGKQTYFIEAIKYKDENNKNLYKDTFKVKDFLEAIDATKYTEDDYEIITGELNLNKCQYYRPDEATYENKWCDCGYGGATTRECIYQKMGYCPYQFTTEKHPRRIRTLEQSKSNRFNLIQELSKVFEVYPVFYIEHEDNGAVKLDDNGKMKKSVYFITEKGVTQYSGFRYEKNLSNITRNVDSSTLTTKLYVDSVDSKLNDTGLCSISTATDNIGRNNYILDFSYYTKKGLLNPKQTQRDIYGIDANDFAFLPRIGEYNKRYDELTNLIINLTDKSMTELQAKNEVSITGITTALEERKKIAQRMYQFKIRKEELQSRFTTEIDYTTSDTYISYIKKYEEQATILFGLIEDLFFTNNFFTLVQLNDSDKTPFYQTIDISTNEDYQEIRDKYCKGEIWWRLHIEGFAEEDNINITPSFTNWLDFKERILDTYLYPKTGLFGQYVGFYNQIKYWKKEREKVLNKINDISDSFYKIYEPYIKEGTWTDSNYLTDNEYYWAACQVLDDSCKPQLSYTINVIDLSPKDEDYLYDIADITFVEDIDFFGVSSITGLPNKEKVILSEITEDLDEPQANTITVQNYTTQFEDLFESITATVQSLTYNENVYKRASNFTAKQYVESDSLQGTLNNGNLTLINSNNNNITLDDSGTQGNDISNNASQYKLSGQGLYFSTDGGETWDVGVGPKGWNLDYAKFGSLDVSKVQIVDGKYIYFLWDKNGINAYRNPATSTNGLVDFARFNKYGLSLVEKGNVRLRAGYEYRSNINGDNETGNYQEELPLTSQNVGFYLYNDSGKPIFKTETASEYNDDSTDYSARLSLKGEMFVTNMNLSSDRSQNGQSISTKQVSKLSGGYYLEEKEVYTIGENEHIDKYNHHIQYYSQEGTSPITIPANKSYTGLIYKNTSTPTQSGSIEVELNNALNTKTQAQLTVQYCTVQITNQTDTSITLNLSAENYDKIRNNRISGCECNSHEGEIVVNCIYHRGVYNGLTTTKVLVYKYYEDVEYDASSILEVKQSDVSYYDKNGTKQTKELFSYKAAVNANVYNYWEKTDKTKIEDSSSPIATSEVGIYINNKLNVDNTILNLEDEMAANLGSERLFMISLKGIKDNTPIYQNLLSVLKNGMLYMGGEVRDALGAELNNISFNKMPDKVRIVNPSMVVSNGGKVWLDWNKTFNIINGELMTADENGNGSLWSFVSGLINAIDGVNSDISGGSSSGSVTTKGFYYPDLD